MRQFKGRQGIRGVVGVVGFGEADLNKEEVARPGSKNNLIAQAYDLGRQMAHLQSVHLLTGGGGGIMEAVCHGFYDVNPRAGISIAVIPEGKTHPIGLIPTGRQALEYPNPFVEIPIFTHLAGKTPTTSTSRNPINIRTSNVLIVLPGGKGTEAEMQIAEGKYPAVAPGCPAIVYLQNPYPGVLGANTINGQNTAALTAGGYTVVNSVNSVLAFIDSELTKQGLERGHQ